MEYTPLLARQLRKCIKGEMPTPDEWTNFLEAVNEYYQHCDRDHRLLTRSLEISSKEMRLILQRLYARSQISQLFLTNATFRDLAPKILETMCDEFGWDLACYWMPNLENKIARLAYASHSKEDPNLQTFIDSGKDLILSFSEGVESKVWNTLEPYYTSHIENEIHMIRKDAAMALGLNSYLGIPINFKSKLFGIIELFSRKKEVEDPELINIFKELGIAIGQFIENQNIKFRELQWQVDFAREAGERKIATNVLHNVGNALNAINISTTSLTEHLINSQFNNLQKLSDLIKNNNDNIADFIKHDAIGSKIPGYLITLNNWWQKEREKILTELYQLHRDTEHIKNIIDTQQSAAPTANSNERVSLSSLLDGIISMKKNDENAYEVIFNKEYKNFPEIITDKNKIQQIVINLFNNAIDAVKENTDKPKTIALRAIQLNGQIQIQVIDDGIGIDRADLLKVFTFGFTTKKEGHGFGLHSCFRLAKELGGELSANSSGIGKGATFTLTIPLIVATDKVK